MKGALLVNFLKLAFENQAQSSENQNQMLSLESNILRLHILSVHMYVITENKLLETFSSLAEL